MHISVKAAGFEKLEAKLLSLGGEMVYSPSEPHLDLLLERGQVFEPKGRRRLRGEEHRCHQNAALRYSRHHALGHGGTCEIVTGYGLCREGFWFQHSWLWDGKRVIETNADAVLYFGVTLPPDEAVRFVFANLVMLLPGFDRASGRGAA